MALTFNHPNNSIAAGGSNGTLIIDNTGALRLAVGSTAQRPASPANGMVRYNQTISRFEGYENGSWTPIVTENNLPEDNSIVFAIVFGG